MMNPVDSTAVDMMATFPENDEEEEIQLPQRVYKQEAFEVFRTCDESRVSRPQWLESGAGRGVGGSGLSPSVSSRSSDVCGSNSRTLHSARGHKAPEPLPAAPHRLLLSIGDDNDDDGDSESSAAP